MTQEKSHLEEIAEYLRRCPQLYELLTIAGSDEIDTSVILPNGSSQKRQLRESVDVYGNYEGDRIPYPSVYEDYRVNCFKFVDFNDTSEPSVNINMLNYNDVQKACDWVEQQDLINNLPVFTGCKMISIECLPFVPQHGGFDYTKNITEWFLTVRVRYVNPNLSTRHIEYATENNS